MPAINLTLPDEYYDRLKRDADSEKRTMPKQIQYILSKFYPELDEEISDAATNTPQK